MECKIWDKTSPINGVDASVVLESRAWAKDEDVILICDGDRVNYIERPSILRDSLSLDSTVTSLEIGKKYIEFLAEQAAAAEQAAKEEQTSLEALKTQVNDLTEMVSTLMGGEA